MSAARTPWHLLLRRGDAGHRDAEARTLLGLWPLLRTDTLVEYESLAWPLRKGDFARLQGYGCQYYLVVLEEVSEAEKDDPDRDDPDRG